MPEQPWANLPLRIAMPRVAEEVSTTMTLGRRVATLQEAGAVTVWPLRSIDTSFDCMVMGTPVLVKLRVTTYLPGWVIMVCSNIGMRPSSALSPAPIAAIINVGQIADILRSAFMVLTSHSRACFAGQEIA